ncbi:hypothetical protein J7T55_000661 [Diaporthe amygdali]|uniref:uncharacterized protein n=1 Tax=Phomopsis amygdali TaxID=1214568 RepID=UPI0022FF2365|nr:uncharacterized protein J7T55_000661 [Diaporthe amygdali]KAJ0110228.1 hypothetical protein J7T55_000661 [Diaporthe amygdali]
MSNQTNPEKTFRSYTTDQGQSYARHRMKYGQSLYETIISHHTSTGGRLETALDIGCGPGTATFDIARSFDNTIGLDPSQGMVSAARSLLSSEQITNNVKFEVSTAEDISPDLVPDGSVDLITAATCAHWFDMPRFWTTAARVLRPGGSVAMWCSNASKTHHSVPNAAAINSVTSKIEEESLAPFFEPGNLLTRNLYSTIGLPWTVSPPVSDFDETKLFRKEWGIEGNDESFYEIKQILIDLDTMEKILGTASPVTRWRQAYPDLAGTEDDVVRRIRRAVEKLLHEAGVEKGKELVRGGEAGVLLMVKKQA